jgi:putative ribosome biogenesis GTPase RsgA
MESVLDDILTSSCFYDLEKSQEDDACRIEDENLKKGLFNLIVSAANQVQRFGNTYLTATEANRLATVNEIVIIGPPRVGKSQLISVLSGCTDITVGPSLNSITKEITSYVTNLATFWDTPGVESWTLMDVENFKNTLIIGRKIRPVSMLIVVAPGSFMNTNTMQTFVTLAKEYLIQIVFVITKVYSLDDKDFLSYLEIFLGMINSKVAIKTIGSTSYQLADNVFLCLVNSVPFEQKALKIRVGQLGINQLRRVIFTQQSKDVKASLLRLSLSKASF